LSMPFYGPNTKPCSSTKRMTAPRQTPIHKQAHARRRRKTAARRAAPRARCCCRGSPPNVTQTPRVVQRTVHAVAATADAPVARNNAARAGAQCRLATALRTGGRYVATVTRNKATPVGAVTCAPTSAAAKMLQRSAFNKRHAVCTQQQMPFATKQTASKSGHATDRHRRYGDEVMISDDSATGTPQMSAREPNSERAAAACNIYTSVWRINAQPQRRRPRFGRDSRMRHVKPLRGEAACSNRNRDV